MDAPISPGEVISGRYRVERVLGHGGMGVVVVAEHLLLGERVAVKFLLPHAGAEPSLVTRFQREARAAARMQSEHVARVMDVGLLENGAPYIVMEYLEGADLGHELQTRGPLPITEAVDYMLQAIVGLAEAHSIGIVHRDLKPSNLFLAQLPNGRRVVKVLDFGIAKDTAADAVGGLTSTFSAIGSAPYMSPEQIRTAKNVDARSDVWSLGVTLYELLGGRLPFEGDTIAAIAVAISSDPPVALRLARPDAPPELEAVVMRCLVKDREGRTPGVAELARDLVPFGGPTAEGLARRAAEALASVSRPGRAPISPYASTGYATPAPIIGDASGSGSVGRSTGGRAAGGGPVVGISAPPGAGGTRPEWSQTGPGPTGSRSLVMPIAIITGAAALLGVAVVGGWFALRSRSAIEPEAAGSGAAIAPDPLGGSSGVAPPAPVEPRANEGVAPATGPVTVHDPVAARADAGALPRPATTETPSAPRRAPAAAPPPAPALTKPKTPPAPASSKPRKHALSAD